jgi:hypothetical protein
MAKAIEIQFFMWFLFRSFIGSRSPLQGGGMFSKNRRSIRYTRNNIHYFGGPSGMFTFCGDFFGTPCDALLARQFAADNLRALKKNKASA